LQSTKTAGVADAAVTWKSFKQKKALRKFKQKATRKKGFKQEKKPLNKTPFFF